MMINRQNIFIHDRPKVEVVPLKSTAVLEIEWPSFSLDIFFMEPQPSIETIEEMIKCLEQLKSQLKEHC